jgi:WD40 repeat protein
MGHGDGINCTTYSPNGQYNASGFHDNTRVWDAEIGILVGEPLRGHTGSILGVTYSPDGRNVVSGSRDNTI